MEFFENGTATVTVEYQYRYEHEGQRVYMTSTSYMYADLYGTIKEIDKGINHLLPVSIFLNTPRYHSVKHTGNTLAM